MAEMCACRLLQTKVEQHQVLLYKLDRLPLYVVIVTTIHPIGNFFDY